jgi:hypothetical protein
MLRLYRFDLRLCYHRGFRPYREEVLIARYPVRVSRRAREREWKECTYHVAVLFRGWI